MSDEMKSTADNKQGKIAAEVITHAIVNRFIVRVNPS
jgi:hypothetical protein